MVLLLAALPVAVCAEESSTNDVKLIPNFKLELRDLGNQPHRPLDVGDGKAHVVVFSTIDCPIANYYVPEIKKMANQYCEQGIKFFVVHCDPYLTVEAARRHKREYQYTFPIKLDVRHELVRAVGASRTPEAAIVLPGGKLAYRGCIDDLFADLGKKRQAPRHRYLRNALDEVIASKPLTHPRTAAVGCIIDVLPAAASDERRE
jgi:hypothetical protein